MRDPLEATNLDRSCPPKINFALDVMVRHQRVEEVAPCAAEGVEIHPPFGLARTLWAHYSLGTGDIPTAEAGS